MPQFGGWDESAAAWLREMEPGGDYSRLHILDAPMMARVRDRGFRRALDVGCGEGRFCRMLQGAGIATVGIDPTAALIARARALDPAGDYRIATAESFAGEPSTFDLAVSYLSLIDIPDLAGALRLMVGALRPGGTLLFANLTSFNTAGADPGWAPGRDGEPAFSIDRYLEERGVEVAWRGIRVMNWHRPLSTYMKLLLELGMELRYFDEPEPRGGDPVRAARYRRVPWFLIMEWRKPGPPSGAQR